MVGYLAMLPSLDAESGGIRIRTVIQYRPFNQTTGSDIDSFCDHRPFERDQTLVSIICRLPPRRSA